MSKITLSRHMLPYAAASLFSFLTFFPTAFAGPIGLAQVVNTFSMKYVNSIDPDSSATDFHVKIISKSSIFLGFGTERLNVEETLDPPGSKRDVTGNGTTEVTVNWTGLNIPSGSDPVTFGIGLKQRFNKISYSEAYWTYPIKGGNPKNCPPDCNRLGAKLPGFGAKGDPMYEITNDLSTPMTVQDLRFLSDVPEIPLKELIPGLVSGFGPPIPTFSIAPGDAVDFDVPLPLHPGNFFYAQGKIIDPITKEELTSLIQGHQAPVPEPSTITLLGASVLALGTMLQISGRLRRKLRKS